MSFELHPLPDSLGAELLLFNTAEPISESDRVLIREALFEYLILIFRAQNLNIEQQIRFTEVFGEVEVAPDVKNAHPADPRILIVSNARSDKKGKKNSSQYWHTDRSFVEKPTMTTILHILHVPSEGGDTLYADMRKAYETLSDRMKQRIEGLSARHSYQASLIFLGRQHPWAATRAGRSIRSVFNRLVQGPGRQISPFSTFPDVVHPLVRAHPVTGRKALYLNQTCINGIEGLGKEESAVLLQGLYAHSLQSRFIYQHKWQPGDLVVWDNPSLMHRATETPPGTLRVLHRTTAAGI
jgi:taurine dioxygenase